MKCLSKTYILCASSQILVSVEKHGNFRQWGPAEGNSPGHIPKNRPWPLAPSHIFLLPAHLKIKILLYNTLHCHDVMPKWVWPRNRGPSPLKPWVYIRPLSSCSVGCFDTGLRKSLSFDFWAPHGVCTGETRLDVCICGSLRIAESNKWSQELYIFDIKQLFFSEADKIHL